MRTLFFIFCLFVADGINAQQNSYGYPIPVYHELTKSWCYFDDRMEEIIIAPQFEKAEKFLNGRALVKQNGIYFYIDESGRIADSDMIITAQILSAHLAPEKKITVDVNTDNLFLYEKISPKEGFKIFRGSLDK